METRMSLFGSREFYKNALKIAIPVMLQSLIGTLASMIDSFMVAGLGDVKMSGVNISGQVLYVFIVIQTAICSAGGIFLTQYCGAKDKKGMQQAFAFKTLISIFLMGVYFVITFAIPRQVLSLMVIGNVEASQILDVGTSYMSLMGFVGLQVIISTIFATSYREVGKVKAPLVFAAVAMLTNTFLNWVLIYGNLGAPRMEIKGAAYATIIARSVELLLYIVYIIVDKPEFFSLRVFGEINFKLFRQILERGWLFIASQIVWVVSECVSSAIYNGRGGAEVIVGMSSSFTIANLFFISFAGINTATSVIIGKSLGANQLERAKKEKRWLISASVIFGIIIAMLSLSSKLLVPVVFGRLSAEAQMVCKSMINMIALLIPIWTLNNVQISVLRAGGETRACLLVDGSIGIISIIGLLLLAKITPLGPVVLYIIIKLLDVGKVLIGRSAIKKERWVVNLSKEEKAAG